MSLRLVIACSVTALGALVAGCGGKENLPPPAAPEPVQTAPTANPPARQGDSQLNVSEDIMKACNIQAAPPTPHFDFDSADLTESEKNELQQLAKCLTTGPLKGRSIRLTGRADPRGEQEYNMSLGAQRANNVVKYLSGLGVAPTQMAHTSRGELDATGTDEEGWRKDRRVDVSLVN
jgi:peptidoglycan-associated lipoprotein